MTESDFDSSLAAVRDNIVMAIERREIGVVDDGLAVYKALIETYLDEQIRLRPSSEPSNRLPLGREWERLIRDLYGVIDAVSASPSRMLWVDTLRWLKTVASACADRGALNALGGVLALFEAAWHQELAFPKPDAQSRQDAFLMQVSSALPFRSVQRRTSSEPDHATEVVYMRTMLRIIKEAVESGDDELARVSIKYFVHGTKGVADDDPVVDAGLLMLYAWVLYRFDHDDQPESFNMVLREISSAFERSSAFYPILRTADSLENELGVHWWEMRGRGPTSGGIIQIGSYIALALLLIGGFHLQFEELDAMSDSDVSLARRLLSVIDAAEKHGFAKALAAVHVRADQFSHLKEHLTSVVEASDLAEERSYTLLPLDPERVLAFRSSVAEMLNNGRAKSLAAALQSEPPKSDGLRSANFGLDRLFPRWYFAKTRVFAEPERLAEELVTGLRRGEEDRILEVAVGELSEADVTTTDDLVSTVDRAIAEMTIPAVVVTNSYQANALLTGQPIDVPDRTAHSLKSDAQVVRVYDDRPPYVAILSPSGLPRVHILTPEPEIEGDEYSEEARAIVGVSELPAGEMARIIEEKQRSPLDEARLRGSVRIRLLEHLEVTMDDSRIPKRWRLPEGTW